MCIKFDTCFCFKFVNQFQIVSIFLETGTYPNSCAAQKGEKAAQDKDDAEKAEAEEEKKAAKTPAETESVDKDEL